MKTIVTLGEILVEVMATRRGQTFLEPGALVGPYPSGAPAIFIDQVARLGQPCGMIGCVGDDDFGVLNVQRLQRRRRRRVGDQRSIATRRPGAPSSPIRRTASGISSSTSCTAPRATSRSPTAAAALLARADHLHVMGTSLISPKVMEAMRDRRFAR